MREILVHKYRIDGLQKKILLLTDIHYVNHKEQKSLLRVLEKLKTMEYDYLCIAGDLLDQSEIQDEEWFLSYLSSLAELSKVIISIGNHELTRYGRTKEYSFNDSFYKKVRKLKNVKLLDNECFVDGNIRFIGVTLPIAYYYQYHENKTYFRKYMNHQYPEPFQDKKYNILLCHTPVPFQTLRTFEKTNLLQNISLILCGHMHGAMTPVFFRKHLKGVGFIGPFHTFFPNLSYGLFQRKKTSIVISSGVTKISQIHALSMLNDLFSKEISLIEPFPKEE